MKMGFKAALTAALLCWSVPAQAAVAIIAGTGTNGALNLPSVPASALTIVITTTVDVPVGSLIVAMPAARASLTWTGCVDSASNTYTAVAPALANGTQSVRMFRSIATTLLPNGGTITCTANSSSGQKTMVAAAFSNPNGTPLDSATPAAGSSGTANTYTVGPTGTLNYPGGSNSEVIVAYETSNSSGTITESSGFTSLGDNAVTVAAHWAYQIVSNNSAITYSPTSTASANAYAGMMGAFLGTVGGGPTLQGGTLLRGAGR